MLKQPCSAIETNNFPFSKFNCYMPSRKQTPKALINLRAYAYCLCCSHDNIFRFSRNEAKLWKYALNQIYHKFNSEYAETSLYQRSRYRGQLTIPIISISLTFLHIVRTKVVTDLHMGNNITAHHRFRIAADPRAIHSQIYNYNSEELNFLEELLPYMGITAILVM